MNLEVLKREAKAKPPEFWQEEVRKAREEHLADNPGAKRTMLVRNPDLAAKILYMSAQGVKQSAICADLDVIHIDVWLLNRRFYHLLQKKAAYKKSPRALLKIPPKPKRRTEDPTVLMARIRKLGALIPHTEKDSYSDEEPGEILDAAIRFAKRVLTDPAIPVDDPWPHAAGLATSFGGDGSRFPRSPRQNRS